MANKVVAKVVRDVDHVDNGSLICVEEYGKIGDDNIYIVSAYPRADGKSTAGLVLTGLSNGCVFNTKPMEAVFDRQLGKLTVNILEFNQYVGNKHWFYVDSVTITKGE